MNTEAITKAAAAKLDADRNNRIAIVETLAESAQALNHARTELAEAEQRHLRLYRDAIKIGWTYADIKEFGIEVPTKNLGGRPRKTKPTGTKEPSLPKPPVADADIVVTNFGGTNGQTPTGVS